MTPNAMTSQPYVGRFAPTPSGPLHAGSLVAALGSYLDAKAHQGHWLVRIEDVDTPRCQPQAAVTILEQLAAHGLKWDGDVIYQSQQTGHYQEYFDQLYDQGLLYRCNCTRQQIKAAGGIYSGHCRVHPPAANARCAWRYRNNQPILHWHDLGCGATDIDPAFAREDFILRRRDGLFAYQLAVVADDIAQQVTHIVRGRDLLTASAWQLTLWQQLAGRLPQLYHLPLVVDADGRKLSKQNHAPALRHDEVVAQLLMAAQALGLHLPAQLTSPAAVLESALNAWITQGYSSFARSSKLQ